MRILRAPLTLTLLLLAACGDPPRPELPPILHGSLSMTSLRSAQLGEDYLLHVYLPMGYADSADGFPVI